MTGEIDVQRIGQKALEGTNIILARNHYNIRVQKLTAADIAWCVVMQSQQDRTYRLPWAMNGAALNDPDAFIFSFKILGADQRPAGACICYYCPAIDDNPALLNIEMIQNFHLRDSILDGNTLRFALYAAVLFMAEAKCGGLRLMSPINDEIADYYIRDHGFIDLTGGEKKHTLPRCGRVV